MNDDSRQLLSSVLHGTLRSALWLLTAFTVSCAPLPKGEPSPAVPFKAVPRDKVAKVKPSPLPEQRPPARYSSNTGPGGVVLGVPATTPPPPPPPTGTSVSGLAVGCDPLHYLLDREGINATTGIDNRFSWWDKTPPNSGPLQPPASVSTQDAARGSLICHFHPALARVVGVADSRISGAGFKVLSWTDPAQLAQSEFVIRRLRPHTLPSVENLPRAGGGNERVLLNGSEVPVDTGGDRFRPSVWLDFAVPQRAVAVEYGIPSSATEQIKHAGVKLIGYNAGGGVLNLQSDGREYGGRNTVLVPGDFGNVIGIQDRDGRIARVELRFDYTNADRLDEGGDPGDKITAPQVVQRVWHEPLPPAAVKQGFVGVSTHDEVSPSGTFAALTFRQRFGKDPGPETVTVPFGFDRAIVMIRGLRWNFAFFDPLPVTEMSAALTPAGVAEISGNRELTITPSGRLNGDGRMSDKFHVVVDYTVLAWRRDQVELFSATGSASSGGAQNNDAVNNIVLSDPCPFSSTSISVERRREVCGPLFGAPQSFALRMSPAQEISRIDMIIPSETGFFSRNGVTLRREDQGNQPVVRWQQLVHLESSDDNAQTLEFGGTILSGTSLKVGPDALASAPASVANAANPTTFPRAETGPRNDRSVYGFGIDLPRSLGIAWPVLGDVAFVALEEFYSEPNGPLHEFDVEVKGDSYQGSIIDWKVGLGIDTEPPIIGGIGASRNRFIATTPLFGAIDNVAPFALATARKTDVVFDRGVSGLTQNTPDTLGVLENTSSQALWIDEMRRGNQPGDALFQLEFVMPRHPMERGSNPLSFVRVTESQLNDRMPLLLRPGERITILGRYSPTKPTFLPDIGSAEFRVRGVSSSIRVFALGAAIEGSPAAEWRPAQLTFDSALPAGDPGLTQVAFLVTTGSTPLAVNRLAFEDASLGYRHELLPLIEPEMMGVRVICGDATTKCRQQTRLIAETNAGPIALTVRLQP